jgi:hypothetical protein
VVLGENAIDVGLSAPQCFGEGIAQRVVPLRTPIAMAKANGSPPSAAGISGATASGGSWRAAK